MQKLGGNSTNEERFGMLTHNSFEIYLAVKISPDLFFVYYKIKLKDSTFLELFNMAKKIFQF